MDSDKSKSKEEAEKLTTPTSENGDKPESHHDIESPEQSKLLQDPSVEVKFISADSKNGDAKIDLESVRVAFSGMGKEELMKFANDPFWVRMRWFLFILFWFTWLAMLVGAIAIIVFAPKCPAAAPREWWEKGPLVPIDVNTFISTDPLKANDTLKALTAGLESLSVMGMTGLILSSILTLEDSDPSKGVTDFNTIDSRYGTLDDFKDLLTKANSKDMKILLTMNPNHSSKKHEWFIKSEANDTEYKDFYVWHAGKVGGKDGKRDPPNNWLSMDGGSAWEWSAQRKQFYLHQFGVNTPDLNFRNKEVLYAFQSTIRAWVKMGISGLQIDGASYLFEDINLTDDPIAMVRDQNGATHDEYGFYNHMHTKDLPENVQLLKSLKQPVIANADGPGILVANTDSSPSVLASYYGSEEDDSVVDVPMFDVVKQLQSTAQSAGQSAATLTATQLQDTILDWQRAVPNNTWPNWLLRSESGVPQDLEGGLNMVISLLPGTPILTYGVEAKSAEAEIASSPTTEERRELVHGLSIARQSPSILHSPVDLRVLDNEVLAYTRLKSGNPGYLVVFNLGDMEREVNAKDFDFMPEEVSVQLRSPGFKEDVAPIKSKVQAGAIPLPAKSALVLTFVPQKH